MKGKGLVLSGGGTKGAFEIGVWKALREKNIPIDIVVGTSVGALNAAAIAQNDYEAALDFWERLTINDVIALNSSMTSKYIDKGDLTSNASLQLDFIKDIFGGGLDVSPLRNNIVKLLDEDNIRNSPIRLGLVTVNLKTFKPEELMIEDIPEGKLHDYLMASAALPIFKLPEIDGATYIDGAFYDNVPINFLLNQQCKDIIAVEFPSFGIRQKIKENDSHLTVINNSEFLGLTLEFNNDIIARNITMGYLDTLRTFQYLHGKHYYLDFNKPHPLYQRLNAFIKNPLENHTARLKVERLLDLEPEHTEAERRVAFERLCTQCRYPKSEPLLANMLDITARCVGIERLAIYEPDQLILEILKSLNNLTKIHVQVIKNEKTIAEVFKEGPVDFKPSTLVDFTTFYVLYVGAKTTLGDTLLTNLISKLTPEFSVAILTLMYLQSLLKSLRK